MTEPARVPRRVVATGTFDLLHPGHLWYLQQSAQLAEELWVIVARDENVKHKPRPIIPEDQRVVMVGALKGVTRAVLGDREDMFLPILEIDPDIITLGFNQHFQEEKLREALASRGKDISVVRIGEYAGSPYTSSRRMVQEILLRKPGTRSSSC